MDTSNLFQLIKGFQIEPTNICTLKCSACARTRFIDQWPQHWKNHSIDIDELLKFIDIDLTGKKITLCGNYGDPIYHPDFIKLVIGLKSQGASISIITNGSYKKQEWWEEDQKELHKRNDRVDEAIRGGVNVKEGTSSDGFYTPKGGINYKT